MDVGIRELKQRLSELLERAAQGEVIRVTDRGHPKAVLGPLPGRANIERGVAEKWIAPPISDRPPGPVRRFAARRSVAESVAEDRDG